jgi:hypothetical protein
MRATDKEIITVTTTRYWFSEDGRLLRSERLAENESGTTMSTFKSVTVYELDPAIRIEAPDLN